MRSLSFHNAGIADSDATKGAQNTEHIGQIIFGRNHAQYSQNRGVPDAAFRHRAENNIGQPHIAEIQQLIKEALVAESNRPADSFMFYGLLDGLDDDDKGDELRIMARRISTSTQEGVYVHQHFLNMVLYYESFYQFWLRRTNFIYRDRVVDTSYKFDSTNKRQWLLDYVLPYFERPADVDPTTTLFTTLLQGPCNFSKTTLLLLMVQMINTDGTNKSGPYTPRSVLDTLHKFHLSNIRAKNQIVVIVVPHTLLAKDIEGKILGQIIPSFAATNIVPLGRGDVMFRSDLRDCTREQFWSTNPWLFICCDASLQKLYTRCNQDRQDMGLPVVEVVLMLFSEFNDMMDPVGKNGLCPEGGTTRYIDALRSQTTQCDLFMEHSQDVPLAMLKMVRNPHTICDQFRLILATSPTTTPKLRAIKWPTPESMVCGMMCAIYKTAPIVPTATDPANNTAAFFATDLQTIACGIALAIQLHSNLACQMLPDDSGPELANPLHIDPLQNSEIVVLTGDMTGHNREYLDDFMRTLGTAANSCKVVFSTLSSQGQTFSHGCANGVTAGFIMACGTVGSAERGRQASQRFRTYDSFGIRHLNIHNCFNYCYVNSIVVANTKLGASNQKPPIDMTVRMNVERSVALPLKGSKKRNTPDVVCDGLSVHNYDHQRQEHPYKMACLHHRNGQVRDIFKEVDTIEQGASTGRMIQITEDKLRSDNIEIQHAQNTDVNTMRARDGQFLRIPMLCEAVQKLHDIEAFPEEACTNLRSKSHPDIGSSRMPDIYNHTSAQQASCNPSRTDQTEAKFTNMAKDFLIRGFGLDADRMEAMDDDQLEVVIDTVKKNQFDFYDFNHMRSFSLLNMAAYSLLMTDVAFALGIEWHDLELVKALVPRQPSIVRGLTLLSYAENLLQYCAGHVGCRMLASGNLEHLRVSGSCFVLDPRFGLAHANVMPPVATAIPYAVQDPAYSVGVQDTGVHDLENARENGEFQHILAGYGGSHESGTLDHTLERAADEWLRTKGMRLTKPILEGLIKMLYMRFFKLAVKTRAGTGQVSLWNGTDSGPPTLRMTTLNTISTMCSSKNRRHPRCHYKCAQESIVQDTLHKSLEVTISQLISLLHATNKPGSLHTDVHRRKIYKILVHTINKGAQNERFQFNMLPILWPQDILDDIMRDSSGLSGNSIDVTSFMVNGEPHLHLNLPDLTGWVAQPVVAAAAAPYAASASRYNGDRNPLHDVAGTHFRFDLYGPRLLAGASATNIRLTLTPGHADITPLQDATNQFRIIKCSDELVMQKLPYVRGDVQYHFETDMGDHYNDRIFGAFPGGYPLRPNPTYEMNPAITQFVR